MEKIIQEYFSDLSPSVIIISLFFLLIMCWYVFKNRKTISDFFAGWYNRKKNKEDLLKTIRENQAEIKQIMQNRIHDREQSFQIQKELTDAQKKLAESVTIISNKIDDLQKNTDKRFAETEIKNNKRIRAELKDRISQSYRYYHEKGKINDMELEALENLIEEYESAKGENSFVHSVVQKEMYTWEKIERN